MNNILLKLNVFCCAICEIKFITIHNENRMYETQLSPSRISSVGFFFMTQGLYQNLMALWPRAQNFLTHISKLYSSQKSFSARVQMLTSVGHFEFTEQKALMKAFDNTVNISL